LAADAATITMEVRANKTGSPDTYRRPGGYGGSAGRSPSINNTKWRRGRPPNLDIAILQDLTEILHFSSNLQVIYIAILHHHPLQSKTHLWEQLWMRNEAEDGETGG